MSQITIECDSNNVSTIELNHLSDKDFMFFQQLRLNDLSKNNISKKNDAGVIFLWIDKKTSSVYLQLTKFNTEPFIKMLNEELEYCL